MNGLRISEALGANVDDWDIDRGHRTLRVVRKGGKHAIIPWLPVPPGLWICTSANGPPDRSSSVPPGPGRTVTPPTAR
jgi:integrase